LLKCVAVSVLVKLFFVSCKLYYTAYPGINQ